MTEMVIDGQKIHFVRADGTLTDNNVGIGGETPDGEVMFFEIMDLIAPKLNGKQKYKRIIIRRVFPVIVEPKNDNPYQ